MKIIEYSPKQKAFHSTTIEEMCLNNITNIINNLDSGYIPIAVVKNDEEVNEAINKLKFSINN